MNKTMTDAAAVPMVQECMRQIFEAQCGAELIGASRLARALAARAQFDDLVMKHQARPESPRPRGRE